MFKKLNVVFVALVVLMTLTAASCSKSPDAASIADATAVAEWLTQNNVKMYGAYWCPHCSDQKDIFGTVAFKKVNYIECSTPDGRGQTQECKDANITSYPTWEFADGSRVSDVLSLDELKEKTNFPVENTSPQTSS